MSMTEVSIPLPFNLTWDEVQLEPTNTRGVLRSLAYNLAWLDENEMSSDPESVELIFRSVAVLHHKFPEASIDECLQTAIVWLCG